MTLMDNDTAGTASAVSDAVLSSERLLYSPHRAETFYGVPAGHTPAAAVALPAMGERVHLDTGTGWVEGVWLTLGAPTTEDAPVVPVWLYHDGTTGRYMCRVESLDIRTSLRAAAVEDPLIAAQYRALATMGERADVLEQVRQRREREREQWLDELVTDAHRTAEAHDLCGVFDQFMADHNLPTRERTYNVTVEVTSRVVLSRQAQSEQGAEDAVDTYDVSAALADGYVTDWSVDQVTID